MKTTVIIFAIYLLKISNGLKFKYHTNQELFEVLRTFNNSVKMPLRTNVYSIGTTLDGNNLWVAKITGVKEGTLKIPNVKLIGNIHGNEVVGREVLIHFLYYLKEEYEKGNTTIGTLLNTTRIFILPSMNPDGFNRSGIEENCDSDVGRTNGKGHVDLNRSFKDVFHENPINPQPETIAIIKWMESIPFILSASLHGGAMVVNYPYDSLRDKSSDYHIKDFSSLTPDNDVFVHLSKTYASKNRAILSGKSCSSNNFEGGIVNGASWYSLVGGMQDYNYFQHGCMELTLEISCCKYPAAENLESHWNENREALLAFCQEAHRGIYGQVLDVDTKEPISNAQLKISGRNMTFKSFNGTGEFWRILLPNNYTLEVQAEGYHNKSISFEIPTNGKLEKDIFLTNISIPLTTATTKSTSIKFDIPTDSELAKWDKKSWQRYPETTYSDFPKFGAEMLLNNSSRCSFNVCVMCLLVFFKNVSFLFQKCMNFGIF